MTVLGRSLTAIVYGSSKVGKSTLSVTSPAPRLYLDVESASRFLDIKPILWNPAADPPPEDDGTWDTCVVPTRDWGTVEQAYKWLASGKHPFKSFIIDSISELQQRYIEQISGRGQMRQQDWGDAFRTVAGLVRDIRDLTLHPTQPLDCVVLVAMAKQVDDKWRPHAQGQLGTTLPYYLDLVGYLYVEQETNELTGEITEVRKLLTRPTALFEAGERVGGKIPRIVVEPDFEEMINTIFDGDAPED
jgi:hypothetical protein